MMHTPANRSVRVGAVMFVLWGVLHIVVGVIGVQQFLVSPPLGVLVAYGATISPGDAGRTLELAAHVALEFSVILGGYGLLAIWAAVLAWRGQTLGCWINIVMLGIVDLAFIVALMLPGYIGFWMGIWGPLLYVLGVGFTAYGLANKGAAARTPVAAGGPA